MVGVYHVNLVSISSSFHYMYLIIASDAQGRTLLVVCDYFSGFIKVKRLQSTTSSGVSKALRVLFARYGIPNVLVTDNGPQFAATEFATFTNKWGFQHVTSSPRYPQSNGRR